MRGNARYASKKQTLCAYLTGIIGVVSNVYIGKTVLFNDRYGKSSMGTTNFCIRTYSRCVRILYGAIIMPSIYSFSLDNYKHVELIKLMESTKNRSALIRHALHLVNDQYAQREYRKKLEKLVRTYCDAAGYVQPNLQRVWEGCKENNNVRDFGYSTIEDLQDLLRAHQEDRNSSQEQE